MGESKGDMERNGNSIPAILIRSVGLIVLGATVAFCGFVYYKFESIETKISKTNERVSREESKVHQFHLHFYKWQQRHEEIDDKQWEAIRRNHQ